MMEKMRHRMKLVYLDVLADFLSMAYPGERLADRTDERLPEPLRHVAVHAGAATCPNYEQLLGQVFRHQSHLHALHRIYRGHELRHDVIIARQLLRIPVISQKVV